MKILGTLAEWIRVVAHSGTLVAVVFLWEGLTKRDSLARIFNSVASFAFVSLAYGMMMVFGWRVLHGGIAVIFAAAVLTPFPGGLSKRTSRTTQSRIEKKWTSYDRQRMLIL